MSTFKMVLKRKPTNLSIVFIFYVLLSYIFIRSEFKSGMLYTGHDLLFHINRLEEIYQGVIHGQFIPNVSLFTFNQVGDGVNFFYPWVCIYPFVLLRLIIGDPVNSIYFGIALFTLITLLIAHFSMRQFSHSTVQSIIFAVVYTFSMYRAFNVFPRFDLGESIAITFLPLVFLGIYNALFGNEKKWYYLSIGMSGLIFSHLLSALLTVIFLAFIFVCSWIKVKNKVTRIKYLLISIVSTVLITAIFWIPFVEKFLENKINTAAVHDLFNESLSVNSFVSGSFENYFTISIGLPLMITSLLGWYFFRNVSKKYIYIYLLGILTLFVSTNLFPWKLVQKTPLNFLQFPWRVFILSDVFLSVYFSKICMILINKRERIGFKKSVIVTLAIVLPIWFYYESTQNFVQVSQGLKSLNFKPTFRHPVPVDPNSWIVTYKIDTRNYQNQFHYFENSGATDYFPKQSLSNYRSIITHESYINGSYKGYRKSPDIRNNSAVYDLRDLKLKRGDRIDLPFLNYKNVQVEINGKLVKFKMSHRGTVETYAQTSKNVISIRYAPSVFEKISVLISFVSILGLLLYVLNNRWSITKIIKRKNQLL